MYRIKYVQRKGFSYSTQCPITSTKKKKSRTPIVSHSHQKKQTFGMYLLCILFCYYKNAESRFLSCRSFISASEGSTSSFPEMVPLSVPTDTTIQRMTTHSESI